MLNSNLSKIIRKVLNEEHYNRNKLWPVEYVYMKTQTAPYYLRKMVKELSPIDCQNERGVRASCFRIPEVLFLWIIGRRD